MTKVIKLSQHRYYLDRFENFKSNIQQTWREIKNIIYDGRNFSSINEININGNLTETPANITKAFNEYFVNIGPNLAKNIENVNGNTTMYIDRIRPGLFVFATN